MHDDMNRRSFLLTTAVVAAGAAIAGTGATAVAAPAADAASSEKLKLRKAVKFGMIGEGATIKEKFELIKSLGFEGVEIDSPSDVNREEAKKAADDTGIVIHGV